MGAKYTEAQKRAAEKYKVAHREQLKLDLPKGNKAKFKAYAQSKGVSLTTLIIDLINKDMEATGFTAFNEDTKNNYT